MESRSAPAREGGAGDGKEGIGRRSQPASRFAGPPQLSAGRGFAEGGEPFIRSFKVHEAAIGLIYAF